MTSSKRIGRWIGLLIFGQLAGGIVVNVVLFRPLTSPGYLANAAGSYLQLGVGVLVSLLVGVVTVGIAITAWPIFRGYSRAMALWFLSLSVVSFVLVAVENATVMSMLSMSQTYAAAGVESTGSIEASGEAVRSLRRWIHYMNILVAGGAIFVLYGLLYRYALIPRLLAAVGVVAVLMQMTAVTLPFVGHDFLEIMAAPLALTHLALALWLMARGLEDRSDLLSSEGART